MGIPQKGIAKSRRRTKFRSHAGKTKRDEKVLKMSKKTPTSESHRDRLVTEAHRRFLKSGINIKDVYGVLVD